MNTDDTYESQSSDLESPTEEIMSFKREERDNDWQDVAVDGTAAPRRSPVPPSRNAPRVSQPRKRKSAFVRRKPSVVFVHPVAQQSAPLPPTPQPPLPPVRQPRRRYAIDRDAWMDGAFEGVIFTFKYAVDVFARAIRLMRVPLSILLFVWMLAIIASKVQLAMRTAFAPLCVVPGISSLRMCNLEVVSPPVAPKWKPRRADYPKMVDLQSKTFEKLLDTSALVGSSGLSLSIKNSEMATKDLATLVRASDMKSKQSIEEVLNMFINDARKAGRSLSKLNAKIGGAVDGITAVNDYALHAIQEAYANGPSVFDALIPWSNKADTKRVVTKTFSEAMEVLSAHLRRLILEAEISHNSLEKLEEHLGALYDVIVREDSSISTARAELLSDLWTKLGRNRAQVREHDTNLSLLKNLGTYRDKALVHVTSALQALRNLSDDIEDLRERVSAPELTGSDTPVEVQIKSIKYGLERIREGRMKAREQEESIVKKLEEVEGGEL